MTDMVSFSIPQSWEKNKDSRHFDKKPVEIILLISGY